jgi:hypothetical protein
MVVYHGILYVLLALHAKTGAQAAPLLVTNFS